MKPSNKRTITMLSNFIQKLLSWHLKIIPSLVTVLQLIIIWESI